MENETIILESRSPVCDIQALVEETEKNCYLYLWFFPGADNAYVKSCWICNTEKVPKELDVDGMKNGITPSMPEEYVLHDANGMHLDLIWFEGMTPLAWELTPALALLSERVAKSRDYWASFDLDGEYWNVA